MTARGGVGGSFLRVGAFFSKAFFFKNKQKKEANTVVKGKCVWACSSGTFTTAPRASERHHAGTTTPIFFGSLTPVFKLRRSSCGNVPAGELRSPAGVTTAVHPSISEDARSATVALQRRKGPGFLAAMKKIWSKKRFQVSDAYSQQFNFFFVLMVML